MLKRELIKRTGKYYITGKNIGKRTKVKELYKFCCTVIESN